jgi:hypothetical protein
VELRPSIDLHIPIGVGDGRKTNPCVDLMRVSGSDQKSNDTSVRPEINYFANHPRGDALTSVIRVDEHIANPGEDRVIGHHSSTRDRSAVTVNDTVEIRMINRIFNGLATPTNGPVRLVHEPCRNGFR